MSKPPWFKFYSADWLSSSQIRALNLEEKGLFVTLMAISWQETPPGTLPEDLKEISKISGEDPRKISRIFGGSLGDLWEKSGGRLVNKKMFAIGQELDSATIRLSEAGKKGAEARWGGLCDRNSNPDSDSDSDTDSEKALRTIDHPSEAENKDKKSSPFSYPQAFELFWEAYPKKVGKGAAFKCWQMALRSGTTNEQLISAINSQAPHWKDRTFIPNPATWLHQRRWEDELQLNIPVRSKTITDENLEALENVRRKFKT